MRFAVVFSFLFPLPFLFSTSLECGTSNTIARGDTLVVKKKTELLLGKNLYRLQSYGTEESKMVFVSLHDDENTCLMAFFDSKVFSDSVKLYELKHNGKRNIAYKGIGGKDLYVDPNRIFSSEGIKKSLINLNNGYKNDIQAQKAIEFFADSLLLSIMPADPPTYIIALHNNGDSSNKPGSLSIFSFKSGSRETDSVYVEPTKDIDDFFIVTRYSDYDYLKSRGFNVVLQARTAKDDGSLSIYCQKKNIPYVNIEAEHGHFEEQKIMIEVLYNYIKNSQK